MNLISSGLVAAPTYIISQIMPNLVGEIGFAPTQSVDTRFTVWPNSLALAAPHFFQCFIHKRSVEQSSGCANELNTFISFNETPQSSPKSCFVRWRIPLASPHNILNFTRVEHLYKRTTVYLRPAYKLSFTQQIFIRLNYLEVRSFRPLTHLSLF